MFSLLKRLLFRTIPLPIALLMIAGGYYFIKYYHKNFIELPYYRNSYIRIVTTPTYGEEAVYKVLDNFNKLGYNRIVHYQGIRPIEIVEGKLPLIELGEAWVTLSTCVIFIQPGLSEATFRFVLLHELNHCYGFKHVNNSKDLMSPVLGNPTEESIIEYAKKIANL